MLKNNSKFPRIFIFILIALTFLTLIATFFSDTFVGILYFIAILIMIVFSIMDKKYGKGLTNHKMVFFLYDFINLISVSAILYYEYTNFSKLLNGFLIGLICLIYLLILIDAYIVSDKFSNKKEIIAIDLIQLSAMICIFTYYCKVVDFWFAMIACLLVISAMVTKVVVTINLKKANQKDLPKEISNQNETAIEEIIQSTDEQGDME